MNQLAHRRLPRIIWVASRPPFPSFSEPISKSLCGITAFFAFTRVDVASFVEREKETESSRMFDEFWKGKVEGALGNYLAGLRKLIIPLVLCFFVNKVLRKKI